jgi:hypothetical protein
MSTADRHIPAVRVRRLANQVHGLGPLSLEYLFDEIIAGADPLERIEAFARLSRLAGFIQAIGTNHRSTHLFLVESKDSND